MERIEQKKFFNDNFILDGKEIVGCTFGGCDLIYSGGETSWRDCTFDNCKLECKGVAFRTRQLLVRMGYADANSFSKKIPASAGQFGDVL